MTIEVHIARTSSGHLKAWTVQAGIHSDRNLLAGHSLTNIDSAKRVIVCDLGYQLRNYGRFDLIWKVTA